MSISSLLSPLNFFALFYGTLPMSNNYHSPFSYLSPYSTYKTLDNVQLLFLRLICTEIWAKDVTTKVHDNRRERLMSKSKDFYRQSLASFLYVHLSWSLQTAYPTWVLAKSPTESKATQSEKGSVVAWCLAWASHVREQEPALPGGGGDLCAGNPLPSPVCCPLVVHMVTVGDPPHFYFNFINEDNETQRIQWLPRDRIVE